jgi:colanic acid/amylovoran biosynthesis glycosyltransferase
MANSRFTAGRLRALGCPEERTVTLPMGVDTRRFCPPERPVAAPGTLRVLTVARLVEAKGIEYALRAVAQLSARWPGLVYRVVGDGPLRADLERLAGELGLAGRVTFAGACSRDQVLAALAEADVFLLPSVVGRDGTEETQGVVLLEAQAMGLPVVASRIGGIPESMVDGGSGWLVPERDAGALAGRLEALLERPAEGRALGRAGRAWVEEKFDLRGLNDRLVEIYEELLRRPAVH